MANIRSWIDMIKKKGNYGILLSLPLIYFEELGYAITIYRSILKNK